MSDADPKEAAALDRRSVEAAHVTDERVVSLDDRVLLFLVPWKTIDWRASVSFAF
jgi:hypothetical protein